jgi:hypothetical protein
MNNDPFEDQLRGQPLRQPPADWRKDILGAADRETRHDSPLTPQPSISWWQSLFWPAPRAWAGLAAVWIGILGLQYLAGDDSPKPRQTAQASPSRQVEFALREKHRLYVELLNETETNAVAEPPQWFVPKPRSEGVPTTVFV